MKYFLPLFGLILAASPPLLNAQQMTPKNIPTSIGTISVQVKVVAHTTPIIFLHGVYFDHHLWDEQVNRITDRTVITLDMPLHGGSRAISKVDWTLDDCADMLIEILDEMKVDQVIAIGHSWGSMTLLRAAAKAPERFQSVGFCNMPFEAPSKKSVRQFKMQHSLLPFRKFYTRQVAKALYGKESLTSDPSLQTHLDRSMGILSGRDIRDTDYAVIIRATDADSLIAGLSVPAAALKGQEDYVPQSAHLQTQIVQGGHISPLEVPDAVYAFVQEVIEQAQ